MTEPVKPQAFARKPCNCGKQAAPDGGRRMVAPRPERVEATAPPVFLPFDSIPDGDIIA